MASLLNPKLGRSPAKDAASHVKAADAARDLRDWPQAASRYGEALKIKPARADLWVQLGHAEKESGRLDAAEAAYAQALTLTPETADTHLQMGHLKKVKGLIEEAGAFYLRAAELDPSLRYAIDELRRLSLKGVALEPDRLARVVAASAKAAPLARRREVDRAPQAAAEAEAESLVRALFAFGEDPKRAEELAETIRKGVEATHLARMIVDQAEAKEIAAHLVFDVSDLMGYFEKARLPTGIQRVQIEVITALLGQPSGRFDVAICSFSSGRDHWVEIPTDLFLALADLARTSGDIQDPAWLQAMDRLKIEIDLGGAFPFERGAYLINLGTSWWLQNYFLHVRQAKDRFGVRYIPFVHDMIPVMTPEHCTLPLTQDFIGWTLGVFSHADYFFTNSQASRRDLIAVARTLGHELPESRVHVVRLDADFRKPGDGLPVASTLARYSLTENRYVLFVSTIESRKNHLNAFKAWLQLMETHPQDEVLTLVCVGNRGWLNDQVFATLEGSPKLRAKVRMLSKVPDDDLANLYRGCAFTLYPSSYEGWGLPVTEALSYGKAALLSDASSLPEAGGDFADYFPIGDQGALVFGLERLMFDLDYRRAREARIVSGFKPRPWAALGLELGDQIEAWSKAEDPELDHPRPDLGRYHWMRRMHETAVYPGLVAAEVFRTGSGWWQPDAWGSWTKPAGGALMLNLDRAQGPLRLFVGLLGIGTTDMDFIITLGGVTARTGQIKRGATLWLSLVVSPDQYASGDLLITVWGSEQEDFSVTTGGVDVRLVSVGMIGFMICREDDYGARVRFTEALALNELPQLADGWTP